MTQKSQFYESFIDITMCAAKDPDRRYSNIYCQKIQIMKCKDSGVRDTGARVTVTADKAVRKLGPR